MTQVRILKFFAGGAVLFSFAMCLCSQAQENPAPPDYPKDAVYQYSVPVPDSREMRAYLWVSPQCRHVRGVLIGIQNMLEQSILGDPVIRQAATDCNLGIVFITPGDDFNGTPKNPYHLFNPPQYVADHIVQTLKDLATESGYSEIAAAPMIPVGHSAATPFVWGLARALPHRTIAVLPIKGWYLGLTPNVPALHMSSEYAEVGGVNWGETYLKDRASVLKIRASGKDQDDRLIGECVDLGAGHYEWNPDMAKIVAMFIRKAVELRLPADVPENGPVVLNKIDPTKGVLLDPATMGTPADKPVPYGEWQGDPKNAFWYFDAEMAQAVNDQMIAPLAKKPQVIDFVNSSDQPAPLVKGGVASLGEVWQADGSSFKVKATFLDQSPIANLYGGAAVGHPDSSPILFKAGSGCLKQIGPDTFRVWVHRGGYIQQGSPWDPFVIAYDEGDSTYRRADRPGHPVITLMNQDGTTLKPGQPQTIDFPKIDDQVVGTKSVDLKATASSALPVQYWVLSGPAELSDDDTKLEFLPIPPRSRFPVRVIVGAYQWGRRQPPQVESALPVTQEFFIKKTASDPTGKPQQRTLPPPAPTVLTPPVAGT